MAITLDLTQCPFSRFGSYFSFAVANDETGDAGAGLYLRTHHGGAVQAFKLEPYRDGRTCKYELTATPTFLTLEADGGGTVEIVIADEGTVRIRTAEVGLRIEMPDARWRFAYPIAPNAWAFNISRSNIQFALDMIAGSIDVDAPWEQGQGFCNESTRMVAVLSPDENGTIEAAIDEFVTTWAPAGRPPFESCIAEVDTEYGQWTEGLPVVDFSFEEVRERAGYVNWSAVVAPSGYLTRETMLMSKMSMCNVFGWDHAFNAMALWSHDPDLAWDQFMVLAEHEDRYGKVPDNMNDGSIMYTISKPPIHGWALREMWNDDPTELTRERMEEAFSHLSAWTDWWLNYRTWDDESLPYYIHGFDSGWDNSTIFDVGTPLVSPDLAAYLVLQLEVLGELAEALGKKSDALLRQRQSEELLTALIEELWQDGRFVAKLRPSGQVIACESLITCMPIVLGTRLPEEIQRLLVAEIREYLTDWGLATEKPTSSEYKELSYWRGPIWAPPTLLAVSGLSQLGEDDLVQTIARRFCEMCRKSGFAENFDAKTGVGQFDPAYTWTSSVFLILANRYC